MTNQSRTIAFLSMFASVLTMSCNDGSDSDDAEKERVDGQLFIVQKNRQNVKLGDVKVILVERSVFEAAIENSARQSRYLEGFIEYREKLATMSRQVESDAEVYVRSQNDDVRISAEYALRKLNKEKSAFRKTEFVKTMSGHLAAYNEHKNKYTETQFDGMGLQKWCLSYLFYSSGNVEHLDATTTDADGKFSLNIPTDKDCLVMAKSSRALLGDKEESYHWAHPIDPKMKGALILSNSNMISPARLRQILEGSRVELKSLPPEEVIEKYKFPSLAWYSEWREAMRAHNKAEREEGHIRSQIDTNKRELDRLTRELSQ